MNINKRLKVTLMMLLMMGLPGMANAQASSVLERINKLKFSVVEAHVDSKITDRERDSLLTQWQRLSTLYTSYYRDQKLSASEKRTLDSRIKKFDQNLFRKKYD